MLIIPCTRLLIAAVCWITVSALAAPASYAVERNRVAALVNEAVSRLDGTTTNATTDYLHLHAARLFAMNNCTAEVYEIISRISDLQTRSQACTAVAHVQVAQQAYEDAKHTLSIPNNESGRSFAQVVGEVLDSQCADAGRFRSFASDGVTPTPQSMALLGDTSSAIEQFNQLQGLETTATKLTKAEAICYSLAKDHKSAAAISFLDGTVFDYQDDCLSRVVLQLAKTGHIIPAYEMLLGMRSTADQQLFTRAVRAISTASVEQKRAFYDMDRIAVIHGGDDRPASLSSILFVSDVESERGHYELASELLSRQLDIVLASDNSGSIRDITSPRAIRFASLNRLAWSMARAKNMSGAYLVAKKMRDEYGEMWYTRTIQDSAYLFESLFNDQFANVLQGESLDSLALAAINIGRATALLGGKHEFTPVNTEDSFAWTTIRNAANSRVIVQDSRYQQSVRLSAIHSLSKIDAIDEAVPILEKVLKSDSDMLVRIHAARAIKSLELVNRTSQSALEAALSDESLDVRLTAAEGLVAFVTSDEAVCKTLGQVLLHEKWFYQSRAAQIGWRLGGRARPILTELRQATEKATCDYTKFFIARAIMGIEGDATNIGALMEPLLNSDDLWIASMAAQSIGELGLAAKSYAKTLRTVATNRPDAYLRLHIAKALWQITHEQEGTAAILQLILDNTTSPKRVRSAAVDLLRRVGCRSK